MPDGGTLSILLDDKMPIDQIAIFDMDKQALVPYGEGDLKIVDATIKGQDGESAVVRWEYTFVSQDAKTAWAMITGLSIS